MAMKISLSRLNESYNALVKLSAQAFPKDRHKLAYKLSRVVKSAKVEAQILGDSLNDLMRSCGFEPGSVDATPAQIKDYSDQAKRFMDSTYCDLWGDPIQLDEIDCVEISPFDLALLDWLIVDGEEPELVAAAQSAKA